MSGSCTTRTCWMKLSSFRVIGDLLKDRYDGATHVTAHNSATLKTNVANRYIVMFLLSTFLNKINKSLWTFFCCCRTPKNSQMLGSIMTNSISTRRIKRKNKGKYSFQLKPYNSEFKPPGPKDLVYYELSPGFCDRNPGLGIQGSLLLRAYCMIGNLTVTVCSRYLWSSVQRNVRRSGQLRHYVLRTRLQKSGGDCKRTMQLHVSLVLWSEMWYVHVKEKNSHVRLDLHVFAYFILTSITTSELFSLERLIRLTSKVFFCTDLFILIQPYGYVSLNLCIYLKNCE